MKLHRNEFKNSGIIYRMVDRQSDNINGVMNNILLRSITSNVAKCSPSSDSVITKNDKFRPATTFSISFFSIKYEQNVDNTT